MKNLLPEFKISLKKKGSFEEMFPVNRSEDAADICARHSSLRPYHSNLRRILLLQ